MKEIIDYTLTQINDLCAIPSPSGFTHKATDYLMITLQNLGYTPILTTKGTVLVDIGGTREGLVLASHVDTLGAMIRSIKPNGRIKPTTIGGLSWATADGENCTVFTRDGREYEGVILNSTPSVHVYGNDLKRDEESMEIILDADTTSKEQTKSMGIDVGDFIALDPRTKITPSGTIKSRFLDDKASAAILLGLAKYFKDTNTTPKKHTYLIFSVYEEVGHGTTSGIPNGVTEMISVDMGCVGDDLECTEQKVSICAKDSAGPYNYQTTSELVNISKELQIDYSIDIYPKYGSDVDATLRSGHELRHGLIGPGVYASHNYERTHRLGIENTFRLLHGYITK